MTVKKPKVAVIGGSYIDMAVKCEHIPAAGEFVMGSGFSYIPTGPGPMEAVQAALCGCEVHLISKIGGCPFGHLMLEVLNRYRVDTEYTFIAESKNTGSIVTFVNADGENASVMCTGANSAFGHGDIESAEQIIADADVCLIHGKLPEEAIIKAIRTAKLHSTKVILNPARPLDRHRSSTGLPDEYFMADVLIPNLYEAADIVEQTSPIQVRRETAKLIGSDLVARGVKEAVITMGKRGSMVVDRIGADHIPAFEIELVDQNGTGDAFAGALAAYYSVQNDIRQAVKYASAAGALACTKFGGLDSLPSKSDIIQLLQKED